MIGGIVSQAASIGELAALLLFALVAFALINFAISIASATTAARLLADLRVRIYEHLQRLPLGFHENQRQGDTLALATYEVARLSEFLTGTLTAIPSRLLTVAGAVILMFQIDSRLALLVPLLIPGFYLILKLVGRRLRGLAVSLQQAEADLVALVDENLEMLPAIKSFVREDAEAARHQRKVDLAMSLRLQESRIYAALEPLIGLVAAAAAVLMLIAAGRSVQSGSMTTAELFSFMFYAALLTRPVGALAQIYGQVQTARGTLARLQSVFQLDSEPGYSARGSLAGAKGIIAFIGVRFAYPGRDITLNDVTFTIQAGETVALTGSNGEGKSTLVNLLLGFHRPDHGVIKVDGDDVSTIDIRALRKQIGLVPQRALLFNGTIRANIAFGLEDATDEQVKSAARLSQAYQFIKGLPQGFRTEIGDHGVRLSGGQRQRVALARALIKDPPILILDEATSMYDLEGERGFIHSCASALRGRTVILITHRQASLALADRILEVRNGAVEEVSGSARCAPATAR